jgi:hypothetical protein
MTVTDLLDAEIDTDFASGIAGGITATVLRQWEHKVVGGLLILSTREGASGDGTTDDTTGFYAAAAYAVSQGEPLYINKPHVISGTADVAAHLIFGPGGLLKTRDSSTGIALRGGYEAQPRQQVFNTAAGGYIFPTATSEVTQYHYGAKGDAVQSNLANAHDDTAALQQTIDAYLFWMISDEIRLIGGFHKTTKPLIVNYGPSFSGINLRGAGAAYDLSGRFAGTAIIATHYENCLEIQGARQMRIRDIAIQGPFFDWISSSSLGNLFPTVDPLVAANWVPPGAPADCMDRYKMCAGVHVDPRCGVQPGTHYSDYAYPAWSGIATQYGKPLSSDVLLEDCRITGFGVGFAVKGCDADGNADYMRMIGCYISYCVYSFSWGQTQARENSMIDCVVGQTFCAVSTAKIGLQNGKPAFRAVNCEIACCVDIIDIPNVDSGGCELIGCYGEVNYRIGTYKTTSSSYGGLNIIGGEFDFHHESYGIVPEYIIDCDNVSLNIQGANFVFMNCPLIIRGDPAICTVNASISSPQWMGAGPPDTITVAQSIMRHSTMDVLFLNRNQGPWSGGGRNNFMYSVTDGTARQNKFFGDHARSSVAIPIPFCARTAAPSNVLANTTAPFPVSLGGYASEFPWSSAVSPSHVNRTLTLTLFGSVTPTLGDAQNLGYVKGSVIYDESTGNLFLIDSLTGPTISATLLNNYNLTTGVPVAPSGPGSHFYFVPCGHYIPGYALELTWASGSPTMTFTRQDGATSDNAEIPVGAARSANRYGDPLCPITQTNSGVTGSAAGSITMAGNARLPKLEAAGIWYVPRP